MLSLTVVGVYTHTLVHAGSCSRDFLSFCLQSFLRRTNLQSELCDFCHSHRLDAVVAMTISFNDQSDEPVRQLAVYSSSSRYRQEVSVVVGIRTRIRFKIRITLDIRIDLEDLIKIKIRIRFIFGLELV